ncbi:hypothetical protein BKI52_14300 [marine bacterium AO1-C]|nr:hypothetical protein BKI52_14300 [marine bacterium AO1-C]
MELNAVNDKKNEISNGKNKYWVVFRDKGWFDPNKQYVSDQTIANRVLLGLPRFQMSDVPVNALYIRKLQAQNIELQHQSRWLNAVTANISEEQYQWLSSQSFVKEITPISTKLVIASNGTFPTQKQFANALQQMNAKSLLKDGLTAKGIKIGIVDVGFDGANELGALRHVFKKKQFKEGRDFVNPKSKRIFRRHTSDDYHGTQVWKAVAGKVGQKRFGMATEAEFYLARTDHGVKEARTEEDNWIAAVEWMDSVGVRIVNTSLGYSTGFTDSREDYKPKEMDGKTSKISRAVDIAVKQKGLVIIVAAGNEGDIRSWRIVSTPGDAREAISVGATNLKMRTKASYSSIGPDFLPYLKPNVSCFSSNGTSFSAPVISGLAACLLQKKPSLKNTELRDIIEKSAHLYPYGNNFIGYGIPQADVALKMIEDNTWQPKRTATYSPKSNTWVLRGVKVKKVVAFHKRGKFWVYKQARLKVRDGDLVLKRPKNSVTHTTLDLGDKVIEVHWK